MDALVTRTERGLVAVSEEDENKLAKIPLGKVVKIAFGSQRNNTNNNHQTNQI